MNERGKVRNKARATQYRDYSNLRYGNITPTDVDGLIEYHNAGYVLIETKYTDGNLCPELDELFSDGQQMALERLCDDTQRSKPTLLVVTGHHCPPSVAIDMAKTKVLWYRYKAQWRKTKREWTAKQLIDRFINGLD